MKNRIFFSWNYKVSSGKKVYDSGRAYGIWFSGKGFSKMFTLYRKHTDNISYVNIKEGGR